MALDPYMGVGETVRAASFETGPECFGETVKTTLSRPGRDPAELRASVERFERLVRETEGSCTGSRP